MTYAVHTSRWTPNLFSWLIKYAKACSVGNIYRRRRLRPDVSELSGTGGGRRRTSPRSCSGDVRAASMTSFYLCRIYTLVPHVS